MAKGWNDVEANAQAQAEQKAQREAQQKPRLKINDRNPGPVTVRFLEQGQDVNNYWVHEYKVPNPNGGSAYNRRFTCFTQAPWNFPECPGCRAGMKRKLRVVINLIQRQRPVWRVGADGKVIYVNGNQPIVDGAKDTVVLGDVGSLTAEMLRQADGGYIGLMSRDFQITYSSNTFQPWTLTPAMDAQGNAIATPLSQEDVALAQQKFDCDEYMKPVSMEEAAQIIVRYVQNNPPGGQVPPQMGGQPVQDNPLLAGATVPPGTNVLGALSQQQS